MNAHEDVCILGLFFVFLFFFVRGIEKEEKEEKVFDRLKITVAKFSSQLEVFSLSQLSPLLSNGDLDASTVKRIGQCSAMLSRLGHVRIPC